MGSSSGSDTPSRRPAATPVRHRKSMSTSALTSEHRKPTSGLAAVAERDARKSSNESDTPLDPRDALEDIRSLRSSGRRRLRALRSLEHALASACAGTNLVEFVNLQAHTAILTLLARHTASLAKRASSTSLSAGDEFARHLAPEIDSSFGILQGLCLLSRNCKAAVGERWAMEMFLDLLLLLRTQPAEGTVRPTVYSLLDLLFCVLVDSPEHARTFEHLQGLEAVTRVLRGTGVAKEVRMKCCEFLYFWLLPEGATRMPEMGSLPDMAASRSTSTSSFGSGFVAGDASSASFVTSHDITGASMPSPAHSRSNSEVSLGASHMGLPFVPQTPRKPAKPSLGFQTPSSNRRMSMSSSVSTLTPVPSSPDDRKDEDDGSLTRRDSKAWAAAQRRSLMTPREEPSSRASSGSSTSSSATVVPPKKTAVSVGPSPPSRVTTEQHPMHPPRSIRPSVDLGASVTRRNSRRAGSISRSSLVDESRDSPVPATPSRTARPHHTRTQSAAGLSTPEAHSGMNRSRGFPSELTRGMLPSAPPSPAPLTPARRLPSEQREGSGGTIRSVAEKKEMLGQWLGNVDQLVQGVENVGLWTNK